MDGISFGDTGGSFPIAPGRACGKCSLCCKLLHVVELEKPAGKWCEHCRPGQGGCSIYQTRPQICRGYACGWLMSAAVGEEWYPLKSHMILSLAPFNGILTCTVTVDDKHPWAWREPPYYRQLKQMAHTGLHVEKPDDILLVHTRACGRVWLVLPNEDVEITDSSYIIKAVAKGKWGIEQFLTPQEAERRVEELLAGGADPAIYTPPTTFERIRPK